MKKALKYALPLLPFLCFITGYIISNLLVGTNSYHAPHVIGLTIHEALKVTSQNHVSIKLIAEKECHGILPGTIMTQKPAAGRLMKSNQTILVTVSKQPTVHVAPTLISKTKQQIDQIGKNKTLKIKQYPLTYALPEGTCIAQNPQPNTPINDKKMVVYTAKEKQNLYIMPDFLGQELITVAHCLQHHQLKLTAILNHETVVEPYKENLIVIAQKPKAGSFITLSPNLAIQVEVTEKITTL